MSAQPVPAGQLTESVTLYAPATLVNEHGESIPSTRRDGIDFAHVAVKVSATLVARLTYTVTLRYRDDITEAWELELDDGRRLVIQARDPQPQADRLTLTCSQPQRARA